MSAEKQMLRTLIIRALGAWSAARTGEVSEPNMQAASEIEAEMWKAFEALGRPAAVELVEQRPATKRCDYPDCTKACGDVSGYCSKRINHPGGKESA